MNIILVSKCSFDIEQYIEFKMSVLISPSKSLISSCWVTYLQVRIESENAQGAVRMMRLARVYNASQSSNR